MDKWLFIFASRAYYVRLRKQLAIQQIGVSFSCVRPVIGYEFRHYFNIKCYDEIHCQ